MKKLTFPIEAWHVVFTHDRPHDVLIYHVDIIDRVPDESGGFTWTVQPKKMVWWSLNQSMQISSKYDVTFDLRQKDQICFDLMGALELVRSRLQRSISDHEKRMSDLTEELEPLATRVARISSDIHKARAEIVNTETVLKSLPDSAELRRRQYGKET